MKVYICYEGYRGFFSEDLTYETQKVFRDEEDARRWIDASNEPRYYDEWTVE